AKRLGEAVYESRRQTGLIDPLVSFIFDEADEFIRREGTGSYAESAEIAETLARRGRKFGLGLGMATQASATSTPTSWPSRTPTSSRSYHGCPTGRRCRRPLASARSCSTRRSSSRKGSGS